MSEKNVPTQQDIDKSSVPYRTSDGRTYRRAGANKDSDWIVTDKAGRQTRISARGASMSIQSAARSGQLAGVGKSPSHEQNERQRKINSEYAASKVTSKTVSTAGSVTKSSSSSPTSTKATAFANTATPQQEREPITDKTRTFSNSPVNSNNPAPARSFTISNFRSELESGNILPSHSYLVTFSPFRMSAETTSLNQMLAAYRDPLTLRCENVVLPTIQLLEEENIRRYGYGPVEKIPYGVQFGDLTLTWIIDRYSEIPDFFHHWMNSIVTYEAKGALMKNGISTRPGLSGRGAYEVGFKDDYTCPVLTVNVYDQQLNAVADYIMYDVFPMNIQSANLAWADENQYQKFTVTFAFTDMETRAPLKKYKDLNDFETGKINPYEEKQQITNKGRDAVRDGTQSEVDPRTSVLNSRPLTKAVYTTSSTEPASAIPAGPGAVKRNMFGQPQSSS